MNRSVMVPLALVAVAFAIAPAHADADTAARAVAGSAAEAKGDFDAWLAELCSAAAASKDVTATQAALLKIEALMGAATDPTVVERALEPLFARGVADGEVDEKLRDVLASRARARGDFAKALTYAQNRGYVRHFAVTGPFGWKSDALVHRRYAPESRELDLTASMEGQWGSVRWMTLPVLGDNAWVEPMSQIRRGEGVTYSIARLKSAAARTVALKLYCSDSFAAYVNGNAVVVADREKDTVPAGAWAVVRLEAGVNRLLVKVAGNANFALKLCDPATGLPVLDVEQLDPLGGVELPASAAAPEARGYRTPGERALASAPTDPASMVAAAYVLDDEGRDWDAYRLFEAAAAAVKDADKTLAANAHAAYGRFLSSFSEFPAVQRKLRAKAEFRAATAVLPLHNSAKVRLASYEDEDDHPDKAAKALRDQIKAQPTTTAWMALAKIAKQRGWEREATDAAENALKIAKNDAEAIRFLIDFDRRYGNAESASARNQRLLAIDASDGGALQGTAAALRAQGRHEDALKLVRQCAERWPDQLGWRTQTASILQSLGKDDEALAIYRELAKLVPLDAAHSRAVAQILEGKGDTAGAIENYRKSLANEPFQPQVWRALGRLEGHDSDFGAAFEPDANDLIAKLPSTEELKKQHPKAVAVTVLDHCVTRVHEDGSAQSYVHMIWKILDEKGVKKYGDVQNQGELLTVRAILPDGQVMEPTGLPGRAYNMEGLVPGTIIEHRYVESQRPSTKGYDGGQFLFQDSDVRDEPNPVLLSRFVMITPESVKLDPVKRNYDAEPKVETKDGLTITTWEKRDVPRIEPERYMPPTDEIVPLVDYSQTPSYDDVNWQLVARRENSRVTPILAEAAARVAKAGMTDLEKLHALYDFVNDEITGDEGGREGPTATLIEKSGDRGQLFEALVRAAGIRYEHGNAMPWNGQGRQGPMRIDASVFSQPFLLLEPRGADPVPFVMNGRLAPFGLLPDSYRGSAAYVAGEDGGRIIQLPEGGPEVQDSAEFQIRLSADPKETKIAGAVHYRGAEDFNLKRVVIELPEDERVKWAERTFNRYFASPSLAKVEFPDLEKRGAPFEMRLEGTMSNYLQTQGDSVVVGLGLPKIGMSQRFIERIERVYDLVINVRENSLEEFTIDLGDAYQVKSLPEDHVVFHRIGTYSLTWRLEEGGRIRVHREAHLHPVRYRVDEYKQFVAWCKAIDDAEERKLELRKIK